jgi:two-component system, chemotaxis family, CheB/CheR fusion protein
MLVLETDLRVRTVNKAFCRVFGLQRHEAVGRALPDLGNGQWNIAPLRSLLQDLVSGENRASPVQGFELEHDFSNGERRRLVVNAQRGPAAADSGLPFILLAIEEKSLS